MTAQEQFEADFDAPDMKEFLETPKPYTPDLQTPGPFDKWIFPLYQRYAEVEINPAFYVRHTLWGADGQ